ncbi:MAG: bacterioferritin-associated ferredoxin [Phycisphaerales bacterium]
MSPDDDVCLCFHVPLRKIRAFLEREDPPVASLISECLGAGTGCGWCVPHLKHLHARHQAGKRIELTMSAADYRAGRVRYRRTGSRDDASPDAGTGAE